MRNSLKIMTALALGLFAMQANAKFKVVTTFTVIQDIAQNVAGNAAIVESITKPGAEIHEYEPTPRYCESTICRFNFMEWFKFGTLV